MRILATGFEPFADAAVNPSAAVVDALARHAPVHGTEVVTAVLPVAARRLPGRLLALLNDARPNVVLGLGEARGADAFRVERIAVNLLDYATPDNDGVVLRDEPIVPGGPAAYWATLPARPAVDAVRGARPAVRRVDVRRVLHVQPGDVPNPRLGRPGRPGLAGRPTRVGFLHLPSLPEQFAAGTRAAGTPVPLDVQVAAVTAVIRAATTFGTASPE